MTYISQNKATGRRGGRTFLFRLFTVFLLLVLFALPTYAAGKVSVTLDGKEILSGKSTIIDSTTYVPLRSFCQTVDSCRISWNSATKTAAVDSDSITITAKTGTSYLTVNGARIGFSGSVINRGGTLYVPIRPLAQAFGLRLTWQASTATVSLRRESAGDSDSESDNNSTGGNTSESNPETTPVGRNISHMSESDLKNFAGTLTGVSVDADALYWLSRIIEAEAGAEPFRGQIAVGNVIFNRMASAEFPNTVYGVIFDRKYGVQFEPVSNGTIYRTPSASSILAARVCLCGYTLSTDALYFLNPSLATNHWIIYNRTYLFTIGTHQFYR